MVKKKKKIDKPAPSFKKLRLVVEDSPDPIVVADSKGVILYANKVEKIAGLAVKEVLKKGVKIQELWGGLMNKKSSKSLWKNVRIKKKTLRGEITNERENGERYDAEVSITPILDRKGEVEYFVGVERDISHAKKVARMKDEFLSIASHELRTPMTAIKGFLDMVIKEEVGGVRNAKIKEYLQLAYEGNERMIELVNDMLNVSRIEAGRMEFSLKEAVVEDLIARSVKEFSTLCQARDLKLEYIKPSKPLPKVVVAEDKFRMVLTNLIGNAIKFTSEGGIKVLTEVKDQEVIVQVKDTGTGISKEDQDKLFIKFSQLGNIMSGKGKGTGLGLYISKRIVERLGGRIWLSSEGEGKGSTFSFSTPIKDSKASKEAIMIIRRGAKIRSN